MDVIDGEVFWGPDSDDDALEGYARGGLTPTEEDG